MPKRPIVCLIFALTLLITMSAITLAGTAKKADALDAIMDPDQQSEYGLDVLNQYQRDGIAKVILQAYKSGQEQQFRVTSSYGSFVAGLVEFDGSKFIFDLNPIEMSRLKRAIPDLEWLPDSRLVLYPYQVTWLRR